MEIAAPVPTILIVDDTTENLIVLNQILRSDYALTIAKSGEKALQLALETQPDLILLDVVMPGMSGIDVCRALKADPRLRHIPVIFCSVLGAEHEEQLGFDVGAVDYITKPLSPALVRARIRTHLALQDQNRALEQMVRKRTRDLAEKRLEVVRKLGRAAEYRDNETGLHVVRMSYYSRTLAASLGLKEAELDRLLQAAPMHDVGKIGVPDSILQKPGKLDEAEWVIMRKHPKIGAHILDSPDDPLLQDAGLIALNHHEKWDGSGYPNRRAGEEIPLFARIVALADVFDALTTARPYKRAWPVPEALSYIRGESGTHFDPRLIPRFFDALPEILEIKQRYAEDSVEPRDLPTVTP